MSAPVCIHGTPAGYMESASTVGRITLWTCAICGCIIPSGALTHHEQWHEKLRRAVDETEMLG